jgi:hypothetical protein
LQYYLVKPLKGDKIENKTPYNVSKDELFISYGKCK